VHRPNCCARGPPIAPGDRLLRQETACCAEPPRASPTKQARPKLAKVLGNSVAGRVHSLQLPARPYLRPNRSTRTVGALWRSERSAMPPSNPSEHACEGENEQRHHELHDRGDLKQQDRYGHVGTRGKCNEAVDI